MLDGYRARVSSGYSVSSHRFPVVVGVRGHKGQRVGIFYIGKKKKRRGRFRQQGLKISNETKVDDISTFNTEGRLSGSPTMKAWMRPKNIIISRTNVRVRASPD